jgi:hypothetical protein
MVEGEPEDAFPDQLRYTVQNGETVEIEPLAGDVRAETFSASLKKLRNEKLRLLAPMLGVNYDQLRQRARRRKMRISPFRGPVRVIPFLRTRSSWTPPPSNSPTCMPMTAKATLCW